MQDKEHTSCCGLYCGDCVPANESLFEAAERLRQVIDDTQFDEYARFKSTKNRTFGSFGVFREALDAILTLRCPTFETCELLEPLCACHGDTHRHNLRMIRQYGVANSSHKRGRHYLWQKSGTQQRH